MSNSPRIVILTGAGISAESGLATFRDSNGLWENHRVEEVATPEGFAKDPVLVHRFYNLRRASLKKADPNAAHQALAELQRELPGQVTLVTQNVDDLHERGGSTGVIHMHGELLKTRCGSCESVKEWHEDLSTETTCEFCQTPGKLRPHIVWFGEMPFHMDAIHEALHECDVFVSIGTSGAVYPAAGFVRTAAMSGAHCVEFNVERTEISRSFHEHIVGPASVEVPKWVRGLLAGENSASS